MRTTTSVLLPRFLSVCYAPMGSPTTYSADGLRNRYPARQLHPGERPGCRSQQNCLVISSSHVNVDLNGQAITCLVPGDFPAPCSAFEDSLAGIGIDIEANRVSVSNGGVQNYETGIAGTAEYISATNLSLATFTGIVLSDVSYSAFANIEYEGVDLDGLPVTPGPVLSVSGGGFNIFTSINSSANTYEGIILSNSNSNFIAGADLSCSAEGVSGPGISIGPGTRISSPITMSLCCSVTGSSWAWEVPKT